MKKFIEILFASLFIIGLIILSIMYSVYCYNDCLNVGHSKTYCILHFGK